jgi:hypothetical protein
VRNGGVPDTSFHRGQLVLRYGDLLLAAAPNPSDPLQFLKDVAERAWSNHQELEESQVREILDRKDLPQVAEELGKAILEFLLPEGAGKVLEKAFSLIRTVRNTCAHHESTNHI